MNKRNIRNKHCPICEYQFKECQCMYGGSAHPNRYNRERVVLDHLYLLSKKQIAHIQKLQEYQCASYSDAERTKEFNELKKFVETKK